MKVTVEFDVKTSPQWYIIDGQDGFDKGVDEFTDKIIDAYEAQKPKVFEWDGYTITETTKGYYLIGKPPANPDIHSVRSSLEAWSDVEAFVRNPDMREFVKPAAVLAEFLEERGL